MDPVASKPNVSMICPNLKCRKVLQVPEKYRGQHVKCRFCGLTFMVPQVKAETKPPKKNNAEEATDKTPSKEEEKKA